MDLAEVVLVEALAGVMVLVMVMAVVMEMEMGMEMEVNLGEVADQHH